MRRWQWVFGGGCLVLSLTGALPGCGGGDNGDLFSGGDDAGPDASGGTGGDGGTGGSSGTGGGGAGGADASDDHQDAADDVTADGSEAGDTGGAGGGGGTGGTGGQGGSTTCGGLPSCDDGIACTTDVCENDACVHLAAAPGTGPCPASAYCDPANGCVARPVCATDQDCVAAFNDTCKQSATCDQATSTCTFTWMDKDGDGHVPLACGGDDCNDAPGTGASVHPGAAEICDGVDGNCDGKVDENATCPGLKVCSGGTCTCPMANQCGASCVDKTSDPLHCGTCGNACPFGIPCVNSVCQCPSSGALCNNVCVETQTDPANCGTCGHQCGPGYACSGGQCTCSKSVCGNACIDTTTDELNCGTCNHACATGASCSASQCNCPVNQSVCGSKCTDKKIDPKNCGTCGVTCAADRVCSGGQCVCPSGQTACNGACTNTNSDAKNCGTCGNSCGLGACVSGHCQCDLDVLLLVDRTGSMTDSMGTGTKMSAQIAAVKQFVGESTNASIAIQYHAVDVPGGSYDSCNAADYANPTINSGSNDTGAPFGTSVTAIQSSLSAQSAVTGSPTDVVVVGGAVYARNWAAAHPGHRVVVVLIADTIPPFVCGTTVQSVVDAASGAFNGSPAVPVYVLGVSPTTTDSGNWNAVAQAGGGSYFPITSQNDFLTALRTIRDANTIACN